MTRTIVWMCVAIALVGCDSDPVAVGPPAQVSIEPAPDSIHFGESLALQAVPRDAAGRVSAQPVSWSSSDPTVLEVTQEGMLFGARPGVAVIEAVAGDARASAAVRVVTSQCEIIHTIQSANAFAGTLILAGATRYAEGPGAATVYQGVPLFYGSGIAYGTHPDTTSVGYDYYSGLRDAQGGVCRANDDPMHTVSLLGLSSHLDASHADVRGLVVVQDQYAFSGQMTDEYVLFRYTFTNTRSSTIEDLRIGVVVDFDVYQASENLGLFDPTEGVAYVVSADSLDEQVTGGLILLDAAVAGYRVAPTTPSAPTRADYFEMLAPAAPTASLSEVQDVKQILAAQPITLNPGESRTVGYALVAGADRQAFLHNARAARELATMLW